METVVKLNWLPVSKAVELNILKLSHKSLHDESFPECFKLNLHKAIAYSLKFSIAHVFSISGESSTFRHHLFLINSM